jgi:glycosyltransferase involved in cell wall biosynthesis
VSGGPWRSRSSARARRGSSHTVDDVDASARRAFEAASGVPGFAPILVVIAAYQEESTIGAVLDAVPDQSRGLAIDTLVVVDGATDTTAEVARAHGAFVCECAVNRGQGAALHLGYELARRYGARFIVTTDADGQYDMDQLPVLLDPLLSGEADFVTGSRWLGAQETTDLVRRIGSKVFARATTLLTGHTITDTSFGFRAMRADVTRDLTLLQSQYQSAELLLEVLAHGYRVVERPLTLRRRAAGRSKKGGNVAYGARYAGVVAVTWWRNRQCWSRPARHHHGGVRRRAT